MKHRPALLACVALALAAQPVLAQQGDVAPPAADPALYQPQDKLERGLWMQVDDMERNIKASPLVMRDPALNAYVRGVLCRTTGEAQCRNIRLYIVRTPEFNASMAPNGMMVVYSGLLLRTQNEAQLAAVLGHEFTHFEGKHSLKLFRDIKSKSASAAWLAFTGIGLIASIGMMASIAQYSREMEQEADAGGLALLANAGYDAQQAAVVWEQLREEMDATAAERGTKSRKDKNGGMFASHPPSAERVAYLKEQAKAQPGNPEGAGGDSYRQAMALFWPAFVDDQLKQNDFGASDYLLASMARAGWTPGLLYARGELYRRRAGDEDLTKAASFYGEAIAAGGEMPELWRGRGLALTKLGQQDPARLEAARADLREYLHRSPDAPDKGMIAMISGVEQ